jgi:hypothetical protein
MKNPRWFKHDENARNDEGMLMLRAEHGWEGYGIYWCLIEIMSESGGLKLRHDRIRGVAINYNIDITVLSGIINTAITEGLFERDDEYFWSNRLRRDRESYQEMIKNKSKAGKKGMKTRWGSDNSDITELKQSNNSDITGDNRAITDDNDKIRLDKIREEEIREEEKKIPQTSFSGPRFLLDLSLNFHKRQKLNGYAHVEFKKGKLDENSKVVVSGAETLRKLMDIDGESEEDIRQVLDFILKDTDFWRDQVISLSGLRGKKNTDGNYKYFTIKNKLKSENKSDKIFASAYKWAEEQDKLEAENGS